MSLVYVSDSLTFDYLFIKLMALSRGADRLSRQHSLRVLSTNTHTGTSQIERFAHIQHTISPITVLSIANITFISRRTR